jgi:HD-GYP domain-containing protein (c-di-GMP phosphodiesterase class II)
MADADACHIFLSKEFAKGLNNSDIVLVGSSADFEDDIYSVGYSLREENLVTDAYQDMEIIKTRNSKKLYENFKEFQKFENKVCTIIPMTDGTESVGVIIIETNAEKSLSEELLKIIKVTARLFAVSMLLQVLTEEVSSMMKEEGVTSNELQHYRAELTAIIGDLSQEQQNFVEMLAKTVDAKSEFNNNHSRHVADLAKDLCSQLGLNEKTKDLIYYAGLLQNIGKITIPEELFNKKEKLSKEDWEILQNHPNIGVNLLMSINFLSEVIPYIHYHKERWDGKGKPEGLKGNSIPLGSRIIALSDAYCALVEERPYRKALDKNEALEIIKKEAESKWDPVLVNTLEELLKYTR